MPDINFWIALVSDRHVHHETAKIWFSETDFERMVFCRVTQMGFLRLITNRHVMGADVQTQKEAWSIYHKLLSDARVEFLPEPADIESAWQKLTQNNSPANNVWTDAYLAAFAMVRGMKIVSFDRGFEKILKSGATILSP